MQTSFLASRVQVTLENGVLVVVTPYDPGLVAQIKSLPYPDRKWIADRKAWMIDPRHSQQLVAWCAAYLGEKILIPAVKSGPVVKQTRLLEVRYLGQTKDRGDGSRTAFGYVAGEWGVIFPEDVLRKWFEAGPVQPDQAVTLYSVLGVPRSATNEELKSAFRRLARQWHPDVCKEIDATTVFQRINQAYEVLSDAGKRARYEAGLALEASLNHKNDRLPDLGAYMGYWAPLRCGYIMCEGIEKMGRFMVEKILAWEDIVQNGRTLVVSWVMGAKEPVEQWV